MLLVGCKSDLRTDLSTLVELSSHRQTPVSYDQVRGFPVVKDAFVKPKKLELDELLNLVNNHVLYP